MPNVIFNALDLAGLNETAEQVRAIAQGVKDDIDDELALLDFAQSAGVYPNMTVGSLIGPDATAQWSTRESANNGGVIVRSVQGAIEVQSNVLIPVRISGIATTDANGDALDSIDWQPQTLRAAGSVADMLTADALVTRIGVVDLGTLTWTYDTAGTVPFFRSKLPTDYAAPTASGIDNLECGKYEARASTTKNYFNSHAEDKTVRPIYGQSYNVGVQDNTYTDAVTFKAAMDGVLLFYELAAPITTPISPALPMDYRVQQNGTESIIVPEGEVSATPIITTANPCDLGSIIADGSITEPKIANGAVTGDKLASNAVTGDKIAENTVSGNKIAEGTIQETNLSQDLLSSLVNSNALTAAGSVYLFPKFAAASVQAAQAMAAIGITTAQLLPSEISMETPILQDIRFRLAWINGTELDSGNVFYSANLGTGVVTLFAIGRTSKCAGVMGVDTSWTVTSI